MNNTVTEISLTPASFQLLADLAADAPNWSGTPMLDITKEQRGNLTQLKKAGLLRTFKDEGIEWVSFTKGVHNVRTEGNCATLTITAGNHSDQVQFKF